MFSLNQERAEGGGAGPLAAGRALVFSPPRGGGGARAGPRARGGSPRGGAGDAPAPERATQAELAALRTLVEQMAGLPRYAEFRRADAGFHLAIASAARSPRLTAAETPIQTEGGELMTLIPPPPEALRVSNAQHRAILEAVSRRDPESARALMESHVRGTGDFLVGLRLGGVGCWRKAG